MTRIAILYICTGEYYIFWNDFFESIEKNFLRDSQKEYFIFTDYKKEYFQGDKERVHIFKQPRLGWPYDTLLRFDIFNSVKENLKKFDYIFFLNANVVCMQRIEEQEILPTGNYNLTVVQHPGFYDKPRKKFTYEQNKRSTAYIEANEGENYICGGVNGGTAEAYLELIEVLRKNIEIDLQNNIIAVWHDESHINKYILNRKDVKILSPAYCYPENWQLPFEKKLMVKDKKNIINIEEIKGISRKKNKFLLHIKNMILKRWVEEV